MRVDKVIKNGKVFTPGGLFEAGIAVEGGKIISIAKDANLPQADEEVDARGNIVIPGAVDAHVHVHIPSALHREDFANASKAAAVGGTTTFIDFAYPGEEKLEKTFLEMKSDGERLSTIDFSLHACICYEKHLEEISPVSRMGVVSFKHFMANADGVPYLNSGIMLESFKILKQAGCIATIHAENEDIRAYLLDKLKKLGRADTQAHAESRPKIAEAEAISRAIMLARETGVRLHVFHVTSGYGVDLIRKARDGGQPVTGETCPHYLVFSDEDFKKFGPYLQVNPPIRSKADSMELWKALRDGALDFVVTDHYAPLKREKDKGWTNIWEVEGGIPGVETRVMLLTSEGYHKGFLSLERVVDLLSTNPAKLYGLYPQKGAIQVGSDADIAIIDLNKELEIKAVELHHRADWTPFEGMRVKGVPILSMVRGNIVAKDGEPLGKEGYGKFYPKIQSEQGL